MSVSQGVLSSPNVKARSLSKSRQVSSQVLVPRLLLIMSTVALLVFGLVMVYSASFVEAFTNPDIEDSSYYFTHQLLLLCFGLVALLVATALDYRFWSSWIAWIPWVFVTVLLLVTLISGNEEGGATRWFDLLGVNFQASEFAKIAMLLVGAMLLVKLRDSGQIKQVSLQAALAIGLPVLFILLQRDLGTTLIAFVGIIAIVWFGELPIKPLALGLVLVAVLGVAMIFLTDFRASRIDAWLDPWASASSEGYQIINAFYAFAGGGVGGVGLGMSHQKYLYLPQPHNDFIFPIIGEEFGLIGTVSVVLLFLVFLYAAFRIARNAPDFFGRIIAGASATLIGFQALLNMLCTTNLLPLTGKPLPFFSAGGSSIIATLVLVGLILSVSFRSEAPDRSGKRREQLLIIEGGRTAANPGIYATSTKHPASKQVKIASGSNKNKGIRYGEGRRILPIDEKPQFRKPGPNKMASAVKAQLRRAPVRPGQAPAKPRLDLGQLHNTNPTRGPTQARGLVQAPAKQALNQGQLRNMSPARRAELGRSKIQDPKLNPALRLSPARNPGKNVTRSATRSFDR